MNTSMEAEKSESIPGEYEIVREGSRNYLVVEMAENAVFESGEWEQFQALSVRGLLPCRNRYRDGKGYLYYDITGKQSLRECYDEASMSFEEFRSLLLSVDLILKEVHEYLLSEDYLQFVPNMIYVSMSRKEASLAYGNYGVTNFAKQIRVFAEYVLNHIDHKDDNAVILAYQFYKYVSAEHFNMEEFLYENKNHLYPEQEDIKKDGSPGESRDEEYYEIAIHGNSGNRREREREYEEDYHFAEPKEKRLFGKRKILPIIVSFVPVIVLGAAWQFMVYERPFILGGLSAYVAGSCIYYGNKRRHKHLKAKEKQLYMENRAKNDGLYDHDELYEN